MTVLKSGMQSECEGEIRTVIFHYHLFKNAGTSVDKVLQDNFGSRWAEREFPRDRQQNLESIQSWIAETRNCLAYSSHTARLNPSPLHGVKVLPVIFLREPLLRFYSAYCFEASQNAETFGSKLARESDLNTYLKVRLDRKKDASARNFQAKRLADLMDDDYGHQHKKACHAIRILPFVGAVEMFEASMSRLKTICDKNGLNLQLKTVHENRSSQLSGSLEAKIDQVKNMLDPSLLKRFIESNQTDYTIHKAVLKRYS